MWAQKVRRRKGRRKFSRNVIVDPLSDVYERSPLSLPQVRSTIVINDVSAIKIA